VVSGNQQEIVNPICNDFGPDEILLAWDKVFNSKLTLINDDLFSLENLNRDKFGPRSVAVDWMSRKDLVYNYFGRDNCKTEPLLLSNLPSCLRPISVENSAGFLKNSTNSGLPYYVRKGDIKDILIRDFKSLLDREDPCVMFTRTQEAGKTRAVWGFPAADTLNEMCYYRPLLQYQKKLNWRSALRGPDAVDRRMTEIIKEAIKLNQLLLSIDFITFDADVKSSLQKASFDYIYKLFQPKSWEGLGYIELRFNTIGLVTPDGVIGGPHGVPSGSTFTNEVDSLSQFHCANSLGLEHDQFDIQGDDGTYRLMDPDIIKRGFADFGLRVNEEKSYISENSVVYLQNLYSAEYSNSQGNICGIYPTYRALSRIIFPERFDNFTEDGIVGADYYAIKTIAILENCRNHPLFVDLVEFIAKLDRFGLSYSQHGLLKYIQRIKKSSGAEGLIINKPSDNVHGLNSFETVKVLRELKLSGRVS
jgi:hypothetical protein